MYSGGISKFASRLERCELKPDSEHQLHSVAGAWSVASGCPGFRDSCGRCFMVPSLADGQLVSDSLSVVTQHDKRAATNYHHSRRGPAPIAVAHSAPLLYCEKTRKNFPRAGEQLVSVPSIGCRSCPERHWNLNFPRRKR